MEFTYNGRTITYEAEGNGADVLIFIPALGTTREMWKVQIPAFREDFTVVTYDPGGHDVSDGPAGRSLQDLAEELHGLTQQVHTRRPHLVGLSMGGMIAQEYAINHPADLQTLVLVSTTSSYSPGRRQQLRERARVAEAEGMYPLVQPTLERWFTPSFRGRNPSTVQWIGDMVASADPSAYVEAARAVAEVNTTERLNRIGAPTLVVRGEDDPGITSEDALTLADHIAGAKVHTVPDAAHLCNIEHPGSFNALVYGFIQTVIRGEPSEAGIPGLPEHGSERPAAGFPR